MMLSVHIQEPEFATHVHKHNTNVLWISVWAFSLVPLWDAAITALQWAASGG